jgi:hypothetical protein
MKFQQGLVTMKPALTLPPVVLVVVVKDRVPEPLILFTVFLQSVGRKLQLVDLSQESCCNKIHL